jgi:hypothetical protein
VPAPPRRYTSRSIRRPIARPSANPVQAADDEAGLGGDARRPARRAPLSATPAAGVTGSLRFAPCAWGTGEVPGNGKVWPSKELT